MPTDLGAPRFAALSYESRLKREFIREMCAGHVYRYAYLHPTLWQDLFDSFVDRPLVAGAFRLNFGTVRATFTLCVAGSFLECVADDTVPYLHVDFGG